MKNFFLHIGAGKTGTSAIQSQLVINKQQLKENNYYYPEATNDAAAKNFKVTSGNAIELGMTLKNENIDKKKIKKLVSRYIKDADKRDIILSSEVLEGYKIENARVFKEIVNDLGYQVIIIYYIRAIGDHAVSSYHQLIKRHKYTKDFSFMIKYNYKNKFLHIIEKSSNVFGRKNVIVKNYDYIKENIFKDFLRDILKIKDNESFKINNRKINRSLTDFEVSLMKHMNVFFKQNAQSVFVSDALVHHNPKKQYKMSIDQNNLDYLSDKYEKDIKELNYFLKESERPLKLIHSLKIVDGGGKPVNLNPFQESVFAILAEIVQELKK